MEDTRTIEEIDQNTARLRRQIAETNKKTKKLIRSAEIANRITFVCLALTFVLIIIRVSMG